MASKKHVTISFVTEVPNENIASITSIIDVVDDLTIHVDNIDDRPIVLERDTTQPTDARPVLVKKRGRRIGTSTWKIWKDDPRCAWKKDEYGRFSLDAETTLKRIGLSRQQLDAKRFPKRSLETALKHSFARTLGYKRRDLQVATEARAQASVNGAAA